MKTQNVNDVAVTDVKISFSVCEEHANTLGALKMKNENSSANNLNGVYSIYRKSLAETIDVSASENDVFWAEHEDPDPKKSKIFSFSTTEIDDISSMSFNTSDVLSIYIEDCMSVFSDAYQYSADKTLALMIQVGINRVYHCLSECFMLAELYENEIYGFDYD
jgi:hypothetical protein